MNLVKIPLYNSMALEPWLSCSWGFEGRATVPSVWPSATGYHVLAALCLSENRVSVNLHLRVPFRSNHLSTVKPLFLGSRFLFTEAPVIMAAAQFGLFPRKTIWFCLSWSHSNYRNIFSVPYQSVAATGKTNFSGFQGSEKWRKAHQVKKNCLA